MLQETAVYFCSSQICCWNRYSIIVNSDWATSWNIWGSKPGRGNKLLFFRNLHFGCRVYAPSFSVVPSFFSRGCSHQIIKLANYLYLEQDLSMSGNVPASSLYVFMRWIGTTTPLHLQLLKSDSLFYKIQFFCNYYFIMRAYGLFVLGRFIIKMSGLRQNVVIQLFLASVQRDKCRNGTTVVYQNLLHSLQ